MTILCTYTHFATYSLPMGFIHLFTSEVHLMMC